MTVIIGSSSVVPSDEYNAIEIEATDIGVRCVAIAIQVSHGLWNPSPETEPVWALFRALEVDGSQIGLARTTLTATAAQNGTKYYAPGAYAMLHDTNIYMPREIDIAAPCDTHSRALDIGRRAIKEGIYQCKVHEYKTTAIPDTIPKIWDTVQITTDSFTGVLIATPGWNIQGDNAIELTLRLIDLSASFYG
jgi:hypothetical protein